MLWEGIMSNLCVNGDSDRSQTMAISERLISNTCYAIRDGDGNCLEGILERLTHLSSPIAHYL